MSYVEYKSLLSEIDRRLNQHDLQQLLDMCGLHGEADNILDARSLLRKLEEKEHLTIDELGGLGEVLEILGEFSLLRKLQHFQSKRTEYNDFLALISQALVSDERVRLEQLINICRRKLEDFGVDIVDVRTLFQELEKRRFLGFLRLLKAILTEIGREDLVRKVLEFEERRNNHYSFERNRARGVSLVRDVGRRLRRVLNIKTACRVASTGLVLFSFYELFNRLTTHEQLYNFFHDCVLPANTQLIDVSEGCVCFTVQAENIEGLSTLWNMYQDGKLKNHLFNFFVNDEMKTRAGGEENVELTVIIEKEEYNKVCTDESEVCSMITLPDIDKIDDIMKMVTTMASLEIPTEGLKTLDEMRQRVKETLRSSKKKSSWTAKEAFSVLTEAKKEDERKRATLLHFYEHSDLCLNKMDEKVHTLLEKNIENLKDKIASHKKSLLQKEYIVLVAGETSSGKSTLLNLILGEQLLPYSVLSTTSTICELRYGDTPKLVAHFKDKKSGDTTKTVRLEKPSKASKQTYLKQISTFVHLKTDREKGSEYEKVELFWPHNLLKENVVIVDSPGIGESFIMDDIVKKYLPEAFAFIYVINSENAGGIQRDRVEKLIEHSRQVSLDKQRESSSNCALFVCNKWDQVPSEEANEVKNFIVSKLKKCWPSLNPESQIIYMSAKDASEAQKLGVVTEEFGELMNGMKSMVLKSIEARLQIQWSWLDYLLTRMAVHTKAFLRNSSEDRKDVISRMLFITDRLESIERQQGTLNEELQTFLENKTDKAVSTLSRYLKSADVIEKFTSWTSNDVPNTEASWEVTKNYIQKALNKRLHETIEEWEERNHVFSKARSSLIEYFQQRFNYVEGQLRTLESSVLAGGGTNSASDLLASDDFSVAEKVVIGVTSPIWVPVGLVVLVVSVPFVGAIAVKEKLADWSKTKNYDKDKCAFMAKTSEEYLREAAEEKQLKLFVEEQLKEAQTFLEQVLDRIPKLIEEDKLLCQKLRDENRCKKEIEMFYKPLHVESVKLRDEMALFGIKEVRTMDISCDDLEWRDDALLGRGAFAAVYRGILKIQGEAQPASVAVKVWNEELNNATAAGFHSEAETLRKLNYPSIVKFYGAALRKEGNQLRPILVMELCKGNLMKHIFQDRSNVPGLSTTATTAAKNVIGWAKDVADALDYIHQKGIVHRDLKLENVLLSQENLAKVADVGVSKEAKAITGTMTGTPMYLAPEVIMSKMYDYKADVYSFGIMLWEMWYGRRALSNVGGDINEFFEKVVEGTRPIHVKGFNKPSAGLHDLMQRCWQEIPDNRPDAAQCHKELTEL